MSCDYCHGNVRPDIIRLADGDRIRLSIGVVRMDSGELALHVLGDVEPVVNELLSIRCCPMCGEPVDMTCYNNDDYPGKRYDFKCFDCNRKTHLYANDDEGARRS